MPKTRHLMLLLLATHAFAALAHAERASESSVAIDWPVRRPGVSSVGPRGVVRKTDHLIEPASFQATTTPKPLPDPLPNAAEYSDGVSLQTPPDPVASEPTQQDSTEPVPPSVSIAGRPLGNEPIQPQTEVRQTRSISNPLEGLLAWRPSSQQMTATGAGLAIAVGLLLSFIWLIRSLAPKSSRPLPRDVVEVLGRAPLGAKQTTQLVRVGSKLVLVVVTPDGAETLTEITDPGEVQRLIAACESSSGRGSAADFDQMLQQLSNEPADQGFLGSTERRDDRDSFGFADTSYDPRSLAAAYANTPGGRGDG